MFKQIDNWIINMIWLCEKDDYGYDDNIMMMTGVKTMDCFDGTRKLYTNIKGNAIKIQPNTTSNFVKVKINQREKKKKKR